MGEGCPTAGLIVLAAVLAVTSLIPMTVAASQTTPVHPTWFPEINHGPILIDGDTNFTQENGVRNGSGTADDPFVIRDWGIWSSYYPPAIEVRNTRAFVVIFNVTAGDGGLYGVVVLTNVSNVRMEAVSIYGVGAPILRIDSSWNVTVTGSELGRWTAWGPGQGPAIVHSDRIALTNDTILSGVDLDASTNVVFEADTFVYGGITWQGIEPTQFTSHVIGPDNLAQGKPIRYVARCADQVIDASDAGQVLVADCDRVQVSNLTLDDPNAWITTAIQLAFVRHANVSSNRARYVHAGIVLDRVTDSVVFGNMVRQAGLGIVLRESSGIAVSHNDLIGMDPTSYILAQDDRGSENDWSAPYPTGGNYWSTWTGPDRCSGPSQNDCTGPDGIVDAGFAVDDNTTDPYPLTLPVTFVDAPPVLVLTVQPPPTHALDLIWIDTAGSYDPDGNFWPVSWDVDGPVTISPGSGTLTYFVFRSVRVYNVTLTGQDDVGVRNSTTVTVDVTTPHSTPSVGFTMTVNSTTATAAFAGDTVAFDGSGSSDPYGPLTSIYWLFGDGESAEGSLVVAHTYPAPGQFTVWLSVANDRGDGASAQATLTVFARPAFTDYANSAGFHLPIPVDWARQENVDVGGLNYQLLLTGPSANGRTTRIAAATDRDPTVRETSAYLDGIVQEVLLDVQKDRPDAYLNGSPTYRTISGHASITFVIRYPSDNFVQEGTVVVSEAHERFWLLLLTVDRSLFALGHFVIDTMATGLVITLAADQSPIAGVPLFAFGIILTAVSGVIGAVFFVRALSRPARRTSSGMLTAPTSSGYVAKKSGQMRTVCRVCSFSALPGSYFCPRCGSELK
ncbi:MAG TPA: PKD domain-containing protein [Thermoplasmata archaeon]|nr:PKD domain-containing protein [Thermoplasmata archaeon]